MTGYLVVLAVQVSVVAGVALAAAAMLPRRSAALRHWILAAALACATCLPVLGLVAPDWTISSVSPNVFVAGGGVPTRPAGSAESPQRRPGSGVVTGAGVGRAAVAVVAIAPFAWAAGVVLGLGVLFAGLFRLAWLTKGASPLTDPLWTELAHRTAEDLGIVRVVRLLKTDRPTLLASWGWLRPRVLVPASASQWPEAEVRVVLRHEMAHIARCDWPLQLLAEAVRAVHWFNPLVWLLSRRLRAESERACDDLVLLDGVEAPDYASRLLGLASRLHVAPGWCPGFPALQMARPSSLQRRVAAMLDAKISRSPMSVSARLAVVGIVVALALPIAGLTLYAQSRFSGTVFDPSSRAVPNVAVVLTQAGSGATWQARTDAQGRFEFADVPPGEYNFEATLPGFMVFKGTAAVSANGASRDITLQVGSVQETLVITPRTAAPAGAAPPAAAPRQVAPRPPCTPDATGGKIVPPRKLRDQRPEYPPALAAQGISGPVEVEGTLGPDGKVTGVQMISSPHPELLRAVIEAVSTWLFDPTLLNCDPVSVKIRLTARFESK